MVAVLQQQLRDVRHSRSTFALLNLRLSSPTSRSGAFQLYSLRWIGGNEDPDIFEYVFHSSKFPPNGANRSFYSNPRVDALIDQARRETRPGEAQAALRRSSADPRRRPAVHQSLVSRQRAGAHAASDESDAESAGQLRLPEDRRNRRPTRASASNRGTASSRVLSSKVISESHHCEFSSSATFLAALGATIVKERLPELVKRSFHRPDHRQRRKLRRRFRHHAATCRGTLRSSASTSSPPATTSGTSGKSSNTSRWPTATRTVRAPAACVPQTFRLTCRAGACTRAAKAKSPTPSSICRDASSWARMTIRFEPPTNS